MNKKEFTNKFYDLFEEAEKELGEKEAFRALGDMVELLDLLTVADMIRNDYDPCLNKESFVNNQYAEGNENAGFVSLTSILKTVEEIINCDESYGDFKFQQFVREETKEEKKIRVEEGGSYYVDYYVDNDIVAKEELNIQFELE